MWDHSLSSSLHTSPSYCLASSLHKHLSASLMGTHESTDGWKWLCEGFLLFWLRSTSLVAKGFLCFPDDCVMLVSHFGRWSVRDTFVRRQFYVFFLRIASNLLEMSALCLDSNSIWTVFETLYGIISDNLLTDLHKTSNIRPNHLDQNELEKLK